MTERPASGQSAAARCARSNRAGPRANRTANNGWMGIDETRKRVALAHHTAGWRAHTVRLDLQNSALWATSLS
jgi:hypothetical protein